MTDIVKRRIQRAIHIVASVPIIGYIYSPFENLPGYAPKVRFVFVPLIAITGLVMWKGQALRRFFSKKSA